MSDIKRLIDEKIASPAAKVGDATRTLGRILRIDEINNSCDVEYVDSTGMIRNKYNVPVRIQSYAIVDWFPSLGEIVEIEEIGGNISVAGKHFDDYNTGLRPHLSTKNDIFPDDFSGACGGAIF